MDSWSTGPDCTVCRILVLATSHCSTSSLTRPGRKVWIFPRRRQEAGGRRRTSLADCVPLYGEWVCRMRQGMERLERKLAGKAFDNPTVTGQDWSCSSLSLATEA